MERSLIFITGLFNCQSVDESLEREVSRAKRYQKESNHKMDKTQKAAAVSITGAVF